MKKRMMALLTAAALAVGLCGCGGAGRDGAEAPAETAAALSAPPAPETAPPAEISAPEDVSAEDTGADGLISLPEGYTAQRAKVYGDTVYIGANNGSEEGDPYGVNCVCTAPLDGGTAELLYTAAGDELDMLTPIEDFVPAGDGALWVESGSYDRESGVYSYELTRAADGAAPVTVPVSGFTEPGDEYYVNSMFPAEDGGVTVYLSGDKGLAAVLDAQGNTVSAAPVTGGWFEDLEQLDTGELAGRFQPSDGLTTGEPYLALLDPATGAVTALPVNGDVQADSYTSVLTGGGETIWVQTSQTVRPYDRAGGVIGDGDTWINMGVNDYDLLDTFLRDGALWTLTKDGDGLLAAPMRTGGDGRQVLTLATMRTDWVLTPLVAAFNREDPDYRIELHDYTADSPWLDQALEQLNYDIIAGDVPDMYYLEDMPYDTLVKQGLLADLSDYVNSLDASQYLMNMLCAARQEDGALYSIIPAFGVSGWMAPADAGITAADLTLEEVMARQRSDPSKAVVRIWSDDMTYSFTSFFEADLEHYVNFKDATCTFDSQEFIDLMNMVKDMPNSSTDEMTGPVAGGPAIQAEAAIEIVPDAPEASQRNYIMSTYALNSYYYLEFARNELGFDPVFVGYPGETGGVTEVSPWAELGISSQTSAPDVCWEFLTRFLTEQFQSGTEEDGGPSFEGFPVMRSALAAQAQRNIAEQMIDQADADRIDEVLAGEDLYVYRRFSLAEDVLNIVREEAGPFFEGQTTAEAAAASIQSRVGLYLSEHA